MSAEEPIEMIDVSIMGMKMKLEKYKECEWCHKKKTAKWTTNNGVPGYYPQPCYECRETERYQKLEEERASYRGGGIDGALKNQKATAMYQYKGRDVFVNHKGDIIKDTPSRPRETGKKDWKY
jgi:nitrate reductase beta subunit